MRRVGQKGGAGVVVLAALHGLGNIRQAQVDDGQQGAGEQAGQHGPADHALARLKTFGAQRGDDHDAERQARDRVHGVVALEQAGDHGVAGVVFHRGGRGALPGHHRHGDEDEQQSDQRRGQELAQGVHDGGRAPRQKQGDGKEDDVEGHRRSSAVPSGERRDGRFHGGRAGTRQGVKRADGQVGHDRKQQAEQPAAAGGQVTDVVAGDGDGDNRQGRQDDAGEKESPNSGPEVRSGVGTYLGRKNKVARTEEHGEKHQGRCGQRCHS